MFINLKPKSFLPFVLIKGLPLPPLPLHVISTSLFPSHHFTFLTRTNGSRTEQNPIRTVLVIVDDFSYSVVVVCLCAELFLITTRRDFDY